MGKKLSMDLKLSNVRAKIFKRKLLILLINLEKVANQSMSSKKPNVHWNKNAMNFKLPWRKLKLLWKQRNLSASDLALKWLKISKISKDVLLKKKKKLTTHVEMVNAL